METFSGKKRPSISLALFTSFSESICSDKSSSNSIKSPRNFQEGVVGLGIVAALSSPSEIPMSVKSPKSSPIPIVSAAKPAANFRGGHVVEKQLQGVEVDEMSESYTCVISHFGNNLTKKIVYFDDKVSGVVNDSSSASVVTAGVFSASPMSVGEVGRDFWPSDFLSSCYLCQKKLQGLDIFMYRGEKAFCSTECRGKHIGSDNYKEKCRSTAMKPLDYSLSSPCSSPLVFSAGVAVA